MDDKLETERDLFIFKKGFAMGVVVTLIPFAIVTLVVILANTI